MNAGCKDREAILREQEPEAMAALEAHAAGCEACAAALRAFRELGLAARAMHREWESPHLWPRIHQALAEQAQAEERRAPRAWLGPAARHWQTAAATLALVAVTALGAALWLRDDGLPLVRQQQERRLLTEQAARDVEDAEARYIESIEKLAALARPRLANPKSPLLESYREKLLLIDAAIAECRAQVERNRWNAHLRRELLSIYQEKQQTLQAVLQEESR
jgi:hypothetical protein